MELQCLSAELSDLKKQMRTQGRVIRLLGAGWVVTAALLLTGAAYSRSTFFDDLKVRRLAVVDSNGVERLILLTGSKTANSNGGVAPRGPAVSGLVLQNAKGDEVGGMATDENGTAAIMLDSYSKYAKYGMNERVGFVSLPDGRAGMVMMDTKDKIRASFLTDESMNVTLGLAGQDEKPQITGIVSADGKTSWKQ